jgi:hypothetical protein
MEQNQPPPQPPLSQIPESSRPSTPISRRRKYIVVIAALIFIILIGILIVVGFQSTPKNYNEIIKRSPNAQQSPITSDSIDNWKIYQGIMFTFKYPDGWIASEKQGGCEVDMNCYVALIENEEDTVFIRVSSGHIPFSYSVNAETKSRDLNFILNGENYTVIETYYNNEDFKEANIIRSIKKIDIRGKDYYIEFGTKEQGTKAIDDYYTSLNSDIIKNILQTFEFNINTSSNCITRPSCLDENPKCSLSTQIENNLCPKETTLTQETCTGGEPTEWIRKAFGNHWNIAYPNTWYVNDLGQIEGAISISGFYKNSCYIITFSYPNGPYEDAYGTGTLDDWVNSELKNIPKDQKNELKIMNSHLNNIPAKKVLNVSEIIYKNGKAQLTGRTGHELYVWQNGNLNQRQISLIHTNKTSDKISSQELFELFIKQIR